MNLRTSGQALVETLVSLAAIVGLALLGLNFFKLQLNEIIRIEKDFKRAVHAASQ